MVANRWIIVIADNYVDQLLETINGFWSVMALAVTILFGAYIVREARYYGFKWRDWVNGEMPLHMQLAVAIVVVHLGNFVTRGALWFWRWVDSDVAGSMVIAVAIGSIVAIAGEVCVMRVVSRPWVGPWPWVLSLAAAALFSLVTGFWKPL